MGSVPLFARSHEPRRCANSHASSCAVLCVAALVAVMACRPPTYIRPDFALLLSDSGHCRFEPVVSPNGQLVYYLDDSTWSHPVSFRLPFRGGLRVFGLEDSADRLLLPGRFYDLALSPDGKRLAVVTDSPLGQRTLSRFPNPDIGSRIRREGGIDAGASRGCGLVAVRFQS